MIIKGIVLFLLTYFFYRNTRLDDNIYIKIFGVSFILCCFIAEYTLSIFKLSKWYYSLGIVAIELLVMIIYLIFYNNDIFLNQMKWFIPISIGYVSCVMFNGQVDLTVLFALVCLWTTFISERKINRYSIGILSILSVACIGINLRYSEYLYIILMVVGFDQYSRFTQNQSTKSIDMMQRKFLSHQYEEIKHVYMNMRGWRHDYHNHIQAMKANLAMNQIQELGEYLSQLERELESVDNLVKSGNIMMDAILNSKISIMMKHNIEVDFKAILKEELGINDIDMCVMVSNLLENAIEACLKIHEDKRFIRIYSEIFGSQFYLSIQNSAQEELDFNQKNYISTKRGEHGLGMKRVQFLVDKYQGYLNLQNEPGIFASEITIPLQFTHKN